MLTRTQIADQDAARRALDVAFTKSSEAHRELRRAVLAAFEAKVPVVEIAARCKVTRTTIYNWMKEAAADAEGS